MAAAEFPGTVRSADGSDELGHSAGHDPDAFYRLYMRHRDRVLGHLGARTGTSSDAVELTALTFERAFVAGPDNRRENGAVLDWLLGIADGVAVERGRVTRHPPSGAPEPLPEPITDGQREALDRWIALMLRASSGRRKPGRGTPSGPVPDDR